MIQEKIVVSDTNIFLDLISVNLLERFFLLPCDFCTTDFVISEIERPEQSKEINKFVKAKKLVVVSFDFEELSEINEKFANNTNNASLTDCSVWHYAKKCGGRLLTGDGKLRRAAEKDNVKVSGILYVFDKLVEYGIVDKLSAADSLECLTQINMRLPKNECEKRILQWRKK